MATPENRPARALTLEEARAARAHAVRLCAESRARIAQSAALIAKARGGLDSELVSAIAIQRRELRALVVEAARLARRTDLPMEAVLGLPPFADGETTGGEPDELALVAREAIGWFEEAYGV